MCGRYYVDDDTAKEIEKIAAKIDEKLNLRYSGDIRPSGNSIVLRGQGKQLQAASMIWGFPGYSGKGLIINARAESVLERSTFRNSAERRRCVIPAKGFYEWNRKKEQYSCEREGVPVVWMAGCYDRFQDQDRFVIITTAANVSVAPVNDRMPLLLEKEELEDWIFDSRSAEFMLRKTPPALRVSTEYTQLELF